MLNTRLFQSTNQSTSENANSYSAQLFAHFSSLFFKFPLRHDSFNRHHVVVPPNKLTFSVIAIVILMKVTITH